MKFSCLNYRLILVVALFFCSATHYAQSNDTEMALYNVGFASVFSGVGALINKKPDEKWHKVLLKGIAQGAAGGYLIFESKRLIGKIESKRAWEYSWYAKFVNSAGTSIVENAASNRNFYDLWHFNIGFNRLELDTRDQLKLKYKLMPLSFIATLYSLVNHDFEFERTLQTGELVFSGHTIKDYNASGTAIANVVVLDKTEMDNYAFLSHEFIHVYQYYDFNVFNTYLNKPLQNLKVNSNIFDRVSNHLYYDLQGLIFYPLYFSQIQNIDCHYDNFFENEAGYYSNTIFCN
jgi:hypothetical protein